MASSPRRRSRSSRISFGEEDAGPRRGEGSLFLWTVIILLLIGFAFFCWMFSIYVFGHPEKEFGYRVLSKLHKLEPLKRFEITAAPRGEFLSAAQLNERYGKMSDRELYRASEALLRNYIRNYKLTQDLVPYVTGSYNILDSYELDGSKAFPSGAIALAQSTTTPGVLVEHIFSADARVVPTLQRMLLTGLDLKLSRGIDFSALINVKRQPDGRLLFTAVPILYGSYAASNSAGIFSLEPPADLNLKHPLPILDPAQIDEATKKYAAYRVRAGLNEAPKTASDEPGGKATPTPGPQLVRVERPKPPEAAPASTTVAAATPAPTPQTPEATPTPAPAASPAAGPTETGVDNPATPPGQQVASASGAGTWPTFAPGQMPRGRLANLPDMSDLAAQGLAGERIYLQGNFIVTASGQNRAVLRTNSADPNAAQSANTRVIVEFPTGHRPPAEGATFARDSRRSFLITDVKKGADGQVNVFVREITTP